MTVVDAEARFHVLAVDDSVIDRKLIEMLLRTSSYQVTMVDSGSKALEVLGLRDEGDDDSSSPSSSAPDHHQEVGVNLIITDYCMPGMTGYDLLRRVKGSSSLKDIPVVIMSSENVPARISRSVSTITSLPPSMNALPCPYFSPATMADLVLVVGHEIGVLQ